MSLVVKVALSGNTRTVNARSDGRTHIFTDVHIFEGDSPYPDKFQHYGAVALPAGEYLVPVVLRVQNERLTCGLDFTKAKAV